MQPVQALRRTSRSAFTLAESLIASVVLAISVVAVSGAIIASQQQTAAQEEDSTALSLARQLMEEISSLPLNPTDATAGFPTVTDRSLFDSIYDFNAYTDKLGVPIYRSANANDVAAFTSATPTVTVITSGTPTLATQEYLRSVAVSYPTSLFGQAISSGEFAVITVTVRGGKGTKVTISRIVARNTVNK
jgi:Tfp pilus assembly protein PilV